VLPCVEPSPALDQRCGLDGISTPKHRHLISALEGVQRCQDGPRCHLGAIQPRLDLGSTANDQQALEVESSEPVQLPLEAFTLGADGANEVGNGLALNCEVVLQSGQTVIPRLKRATSAWKVDEGERGLLPGVDQHAGPQVGKTIQSSKCW